MCVKNSENAERQIALIFEEKWCHEQKKSASGGGLRRADLTQKISFKEDQGTLTVRGAQEPL